jgi:plastocyanin
MLPVLMAGIGLAVPAGAATGDTPGPAALSTTPSSDEGTFSSRTTDGHTQMSQEQPAAPAAAPAPPAVEPDPPAAPKVVAAASGGVTIKDFSFGPKSLTISVGDSVGWTNQGPTAHTATARAGEFDSGLLDAGKSFSHTFTKAGTYAYYCKPHPFMTGTIVVRAASGSGGGSGNSGGGSSGSGSGSSGATDSGTASGATDTSGQLAQTGSDAFAWGFLGVSLIAFGAALRWKLRTE